MRQLAGGEHAGLQRYRGCEDSDAHAHAYVCEIGHLSPFWSEGGCSLRLGSQSV